MPNLIKQVSILRRSVNYKEPNLDENLIWPAEPSYNNPIVAVVFNDKFFSFNFTLLNGVKTNN